jgi:hypothetical protein
VLGFKFTLDFKFNSLFHRVVISSNTQVVDHVDV